MTNNDITNTIKARRKALGLSQQDVAESIGMRQQSYQRIENGRSSPTLQSLQAVLYVLGLQISITEASPQNSSDVTSAGLQQEQR